VVNGAPFGILVAVMGAFCLALAVNTAFVASSELLERVAQRYGVKWLIATTRRDSLYRIHLMNAGVFSAILLIAGGHQSILADMFAVGLVASFCINIGSLLIYRYRMGTTEIQYHTSRLGTLILWIILVSCFIFLGAVKVRGTILWASVTIMVLIAGLLVARRRAPEIRALAEADTPDEMFDYLKQFRTEAVYIFFRRSREPKFGMEERAPGRERMQRGVSEKDSVYITFYSPRAGIPPKDAPNHFRFPLAKMSLYHEIIHLLEMVEAEFANRQVVVIIGWPMSSWLDRLSITVRYFHIMLLPRRFPGFEFIMRYVTKVPLAEKKVSAKRETREKIQKKTDTP